MPNTRSPPRQYAGAKIHDTKKPRGRYLMYPRLRMDQVEIQSTLGVDPWSELAMAGPHGY